MYQSAIMVSVSVVLCCIAAQFFVIGCKGSSGGTGTMHITAWVEEDQDSTTMFYVLQDVFYKDGVEEMTILCQETTDTSKATFGLLLAATVFTTFTSILFQLFARLTRQLCTCYCAYRKMRIACITLVMAVVALVAFLGECYHEVEDTVESDWVWGPESLLSLVGLLTMVCTKLKMVAYKQQYD